MKATRMHLSLLPLIACIVIFSWCGEEVTAQTKADSTRPAPTSDAAREELEKRAKQMQSEAGKLYIAGKTTEALQLHKELLSINHQLYPKEQFPKGHVQIAGTHAAIAQCYGQLGDRAQELAQYELSVTMLRELPEGKNELVTSLTALASTYGVLRDYPKNEIYLNEAEKLCRELYPMDKFPDGHPQVANVDHQFGELLVSQGRMDAAITRFESALRICRTYCASRPDPLQDEDTEWAYTIYIRALRELGNAKFYRGQLTDAAALFEERTNVQRRVYDLKRFPHGHPLLAGSLQVTALIYFRQSKYPEAANLLEQALTMVDALTKEGIIVERLAVQCLCDLAKVNEQMGRLDLALQHSKTALERIRLHCKTDTTPTNQAYLGFALRTYGQMLSRTGEFDQARIHVEESLAVQRRFAEKTSNPDEQRKVAIGLYELSLLWKQQGEFGREKDCVIETVEIFSRLFPTEKYPDGHPDLATIILSLGICYVDLRDIEKATEAFQKAEQMWARLAQRDPKGVDTRAWAVTLDNLGETYWVRGELEKSKETLERSHAMFRSLYPLETFPNGHADLAHSHIRLARLHRRSGRTDEAVKNTTIALNMANKLYPKEMLPNGHEFILDTLRDHTVALFEHGEYESSAQFAFLAVQMNQRLADQIIPGLSEAECLNYVSERLALPWTLVPAWIEAKRPVDELYDLVWKKRALVLRTIEARQVAARSSQVPEIAALVEQQRLNARRLSSLMRSSLGTAAPAKAIQDELVLLTSRKEELEREVVRRIPNYQAISERFRVTADELKRNLPDDSAYIEFLAYPVPRPNERIIPSRYVAFVVQPNKSTQLREIGDSSTIESAVIRFRQRIIDNDNPFEAGEELRKLVWAPIDESLGRDVQSIYLCPDGVLSAVPWVAIPGSQVNSVLLHDYSLAVVPCGQYLCNWLRHEVNVRETPGSLLAIGDVNYNVRGESDGPEPLATPLSLAVRGDERFAFGPLAGTRDELDYLTEIVGETNVTILRGGQANTSNVLDQLPVARWAHFATHGFFANARVRSALQGALEADGGTGFNPVPRSDTPARNPLALSGLALAGANGPPPSVSDDTKHTDDGILTGETISQLRLENMDLVVLSACETGLGDVAGGEGVLGLQRAFHIAGAKNVVASLWKVDDRATAVLMQLVYHKMIQEKKPISQALREAQLTLYEHPELLVQTGELRGRIDFTKTVPVNGKGNNVSPGKVSPPRLWAAFILSGAGK